MLKKNFFFLLLGYALGLRSLVHNSVVVFVMSAQIVPDANDSISEEYSEEPVVMGKASFVDSTIELPEKNEEPEEVETEKPTDPVQKYLPLIREITGHSDDVYSVSFSPDGRRIVSGSYDRTIGH